MGPREAEPVRTCLGCRRRRPRSAMVRIVRNPGGEACFDVEGRLPGRGAWFCPVPSCLDALAPGALSHVLRSPVLLADAASRRRELSRALSRRVSNLLSICRKTGGLTFGPAGVRAALLAGRAGLVLISENLSADAAAAWAERSGTVPVRTLADATELGALVGRGPLVVATVTNEGLAAALLQAIDRWQAFSVDSCDNKKLTTESKASAARSRAASGGG